MSKRSLPIHLGVWCLIVLMTGPMMAQQAPPTMWKWMGIPQGWNRVRSQIVNRRGNTPGLEKKPPLLNIADPANLESDVPAIKAAAEIKKAEDLKKQKIKAIKYLATIGCGCYNKDGKVTKALLAAMEDCTEDVRLESVKAIGESAEDEQCEHCKQRSCCDEEIVEQLAKMAYDLDDDGCYIEPSERVREAAQEAICVCCPNRGLPPIIDTVPEGDIEGADIPPIEGADSVLEAPEPPSANLVPVPPATDEANLAPVITPRAATQLASSRRRHQAAPAFAIAAEERSAPRLIEPQSERLAPVYDLAPLHEKIRGNVANVDMSTALVELHIHDGKTLPVGSQVKVYHRFLSGTALAGILRVVESEPGRASARPLQHGRSPRVARGDEVVVWQ